MDKKKSTKKYSRNKNNITEIQKSISGIAEDIHQLEREQIVSTAINNETQNKIHKPNWTEIAIVIVNVILAIGTILLYSQAVSQSESAKKAAEAAKESVSLFEQSGRIDNRAWVGLMAQPNTNKDDPFVSYPTIMRGGGVYVSVKNFGKTPADSLFCYGKLFFSNELPKPKTLKLINSWGKVLSPGEAFQIELSIDSSFSFDLINKIVGGKTKLYIYGLIVYRDIYGFIDTTEFMSLYDKKYGFNQYGTFNRMR